jgi:hypothetical protein
MAGVSCLAELDVQQTARALDAKEIRKKGTYLFTSKVASTGKCIPKVGASLLAKAPEKSAQNVF